MVSFINIKTFNTHLCEWNVFLRLPSKGVEHGFEGSGLRDIYVVGSGPRSLIALGIALG